MTTDDRNSSNPFYSLLQFPATIKIETSINVKKFRSLAAISSLAVLNSSQPRSYFVQGVAAPTTAIIRTDHAGKPPGVDPGIDFKGHFLKHTWHHTFGNLSPT